MGVGLGDKLWTKVLILQHHGGLNNAGGCISGRHCFWRAACGCNPLAGGGQWVGGLNDGLSYL